MKPNNGNEVKKADGRGQRAEGSYGEQYDVGFKPTSIAGHQIRDFDGGLKPLFTRGHGLLRRRQIYFCHLPTA